MTHTRYALFASAQGQHIGGWLDVQAVSDRVDILQETCNELTIETGWAHIIDLQCACAVTDGVKEGKDIAWQWKTKEDYPA